MSGNNNLHQLLSATAEVIADKDRRIPELKTALAKSDQGKEMKKWYTEVVNKDSDRIETIGEQVQQAVALISPQLHMQRRINNGLVILAEHLNACFNGTKLLPDPLNELEVAKDVVQRLADGDQVIRINRELEMLCHNIQLGGLDRRKDHQAIWKRSYLINAQRPLIEKAKNMNMVEKQGRVPSRVEGVAAQVKA